MRIRGFHDKTFERGSTIGGSTGVFNCKGLGFCHTGFNRDGAITGFCTGLVKGFMLRCHIEETRVATKHHKDCWEGRGILLLREYCNPKPEEIRGVLYSLAWM